MTTQHHIHLSYAESDTEELAPLIEILETNLGAERKPYFVSGGAIDLVTFLSISATYFAGIMLKPIIGEYAKGLFAADKIKALGEAHRHKIIEALGDLWQDILSLTKGIQEALQGAQNLLDRREAISLAISFDAFSASFVLNPLGRSPEMFKALPDAILDFLLLCESETLPPDVRLIQFWYDTASRYWRFVFIPTCTERFVDRYIDLADQQLHDISSPDEFISRFNISQGDEWKLLFDPFAKQNRI